MISEYNCQLEGKNWCKYLTLSDILFTYIKACKLDGDKDRLHIINNKTFR